MITKKVIPVSLDRRASEKLIAPKINDTMDFVEMYRTMKKMDTIPKRKQKISSRLLYY